LIESSDRVIFCSVSEFEDIKRKREEAMDKKLRFPKSKRVIEEEHIPNPYTSGDRVIILLKFAEEDPDDLSWVINHLRSTNQVSFV